MAFGKTAAALIARRLRNTLVPRRLHRRYAGKADALIDYVDGAVPVLARMAANRSTADRTLGLHDRIEFQWSRSTTYPVLYDPFSSWIGTPRADRYRSGEDRLARFGGG